MRGLNFGLCLPLMVVLIVHKLDATDEPRDASINRQPNSNLYYSKECRDDIDRHCLNARKVVLTDLAVLQCIHNEVPDLNLIDKECHNVIIVFSLSLSKKKLIIYFYYVYKVVV